MSDPQNPIEPSESKQQKKDAGAEPAKSAPDKQEPKAEKTYTEEELNRRLEREKKLWEKQLKEAEEKARLSEAERLQREADELRQTIRLRDARDLLTSELAKIGAKSPQLLFAAIERQIEFDEANKVKNLTELIEQLKEGYPEQFTIAAGSQPKPSVGAGQQGHRSTLTIEQLQRMRPDEIKHLPWEQVKQVLEEAARNGR